jgi:hypothetical protein
VFVGGLPPSGVFSVTPNNLPFNNQAVGVPSAPLPVTLANNSGSTVTGISQAISGTNATDFSVIPSSTCGTSLISTATCVYQVQFTASIVGAETATLTVSETSPSGSQTVTLTGTGYNNAILTVNPTSLSFGTVSVGGSATGTVTLCAGTINQQSGICNQPGANVTISGANITLDPTDFAIQSNSCGAVLLSGQTCVVVTKFAPQSSGAKSGTLTISIPSSILAVPLAGTGQTVTGPTLSSIAIAPTGWTITTNPPTNSESEAATETFSDGSTQNVTSAGVGYGVSGATSGGPWTQLNAAIKEPTTSATSITVPTSGSWTTTAGATLACYGQVLSGTMTVTDLLGNSYTPTATGTDNGGVEITAWFTATGKGGSGDTITLHSTATTTMSLACVEESGGTVIDVVKHGNNSGAASTAITTGNFTTTGSSDLILVGISDYGVQNCGVSPFYTAGTNYFLLFTVGAYSACPVTIEARSGVAAGTYAGTATDSASTTTWQAYALTLLSGTTQAVCGINAFGIVTGLNPGTCTVDVNAGALTGYPTVNTATASIGTSGVTSISATFPQPNQSQDTIVVAVSSQDTASTYGTPTDSCGNTYALASPASSPPSRGTGTSQAIYYSQGVTGCGSNTVTETFTGGGATNPNLIATDANGLIGGVDVQHVATGNNLAPANTITTTGPDMMLSAVVASSPPIPANSQAGHSGNGILQYVDLFATGLTSDSAVLSVGGPWLMNTVAFKTVALGTATGTVSNSVPSVYTVSNQQPVTTPFYPSSLWTTPLPADAFSHCWNTAVPAGGSPVSCSSSSPDQAVIQNIFGGSDSISYEAFSLQCLNSSNCSVSYANAFYYSSQSDPVFRVNTGSGPCPSGPNATANNCAAGKYFHLPSGAQWDSIPPAGSCRDQGLLVWDQSSDIDSTIGGRFLSSYFCGNGLRALPTNCTATTPAQADAQSQCQLTLYYNAVNFPFADPFGGIGDGLSSDGNAGISQVREEEIMDGAINHAIGLDTACLWSSTGSTTAPNAPVFPASGNAGGCGFIDNLRPLNGNLFAIDSGYNCSTLPLFQQPVCVVMQTYGGYIHATQGGNGPPLYVEPFEGGMAHQLAGVNDGYFNNWIIANSTLTCPGGGYPKTCTGYALGGQNGLEVYETSASTSAEVIGYFMQMPGLITGHHLHILDPCEARLMAGMSASQGACP